MIITPAILASNFEQVTGKLFILEGLCDRVQIDLCDGVFGLEKTWLPYEERELPSLFEYEFDLMVVDWRKYLPRVISLGAKRVVMHIDNFNDSDIYEMIDIVAPHNISLGLSVSNDKDVSDFAGQVKKIEAKYSKIFIQVMGIKHIGAQKQPFDDSVPRRIMFLKEECKNIPIQVDGSMNGETFLTVKNAGADCAVSGSYIFSNGDTQEEVKKIFDKAREDFK